MEYLGKSRDSPGSQSTGPPIPGAPSRMGGSIVPPGYALAPSPARQPGQAPSPALRTVCLSSCLGTMVLCRTGETLCPHISFVGHGGGLASRVVVLRPPPFPLLTGCARLGALSLASSLYNSSATTCSASISRALSPASIGASFATILLCSLSGAPRATLRAPRGRADLATDTCSVVPLAVLLVTLMMVLLFF